MTTVSPSTASFFKKKNLPIALFVLIVGFLCWPTHYKIKTQALAVPSEQVILASPIYGTIEKLYEKSGNWIEAHQPILKLHSPIIEAELRGAESDFSLKRLQFANYVQSSDLKQETQAPLASLNLKNAWANLQSLQLTHEKLTLTSPIAGQILPLQNAQNIFLRLDDMQGLFASESMPLVRIANTKRLKLIIPLMEEDTPLLSPNATVHATWMATAEDFTTHITHLPQRKISPQEYSIGFYVPFGGPAPQQDLNQIAPEDQIEHLHPIFVAEADIPGENTVFMDQMRVFVVIEGKRTCMINRIWHHMRIMLGI
jgi:multidrug efflux pump subunit AcrA (membrane-fusion protein)